MAAKTKDDHSALCITSQSSSINRSFFPTTSSEVTSLILQLKDNKACKTESISTKFIKYSVYTIASCLSDLYTVISAYFKRYFPILSKLMK